MLALGLPVTVKKLHLCVGSKCYIYISSLQAVTDGQGLERQGETLALLWLLSAAAVLCPAHSSPSPSCYSCLPGLSLWVGG